MIMTTVGCYWWACECYLPTATREAVLRKYLQEGAIRNGAQFSCIYDTPHSHETISQDLSSHECSELVSLLSYRVGESLILLYMQTSLCVHFRLHCWWTTSTFPNRSTCLSDMRLVTRALQECSQSRHYLTIRMRFDRASKLQVCPRGVKPLQ